ncbi:hypothetical protein D3C85_1056510 [compost metagenome]
MEQAPLEVHAFGEGGFEGAVHRLLVQLDRHLRQAGDLRRHLQRLVEDAFGRHHAADQPAALGFPRVHQAPGQAQVHGLGLADGAGQALGAAGARQGADLDLRLAEARVVGGDEQVAHHRQFAATAQGQAAHRRDHRLAAARHLFPVGRHEVLQIDVGERLVAQLGDVRTGGEGLVAAGDDHGADISIGLEGAQRVAQLRHQLPIQRIEHLRAMEGDEPYRLMPLDQDGAVAHGASSA